ncbi:hypothetical protein B0H17DRAFT_1149583 [Mycena rosella]|uniref:Uncharacterized protein n=1 Tax=Mycena rosella TaxID=1033263 RepID=A0AAD7C0C7_MYCRO|nr:hypothetical protein B0H17DRAFT_1149583 [Mycena rosella]
MSKQHASAFAPDVKEYFDLDLADELAEGLQATHNHMFTVLRLIWLSWIGDVTAVDCAAGLRLRDVDPLPRWMAKAELCTMNKSARLELIARGGKGGSALWAQRPEQKTWSPHIRRHSGLNKVSIYSSIARIIAARTERYRLRAVQTQLQIVIQWPPWPSIISMPCGIPQANCVQIRSDAGIGTEGNVWLKMSQFKIAM